MLIIRLNQNPHVRLIVVLWIVRSVELMVAVE